MAEYAVTLPGPPSANKYWMVANNRIIVTPEASAYKRQVFLQLRGYEPLRGDVAVNFTVFRPWRRGDLDNFTKVMFDALKGTIWLDDSQVVEIHSFRDDDKTHPRVEILVYEVGK